MKNFKINLVLRIILIVVMIYIFFLLYFNNQVLPVIVATLIITYQVYSLIKYTDRTNKELTNFLQSINYSDFSQNLSFGSLGNSFKDLANEFNNVLEKFKRLRNEKEESLNYLETVMQHVGVGLISFSTNGNVELINRAAKKMLGIHTLKNIRNLNSISNNFGDYILDLPSNKKMVHQIYIHSEITQLLLYSTKFAMRNQTFKLVALQNILPELEEKEIEAYQKLIRVLTHEIMNSVTPISSLASTVGNMFDTIKTKFEGIETDTISDITSAMQTIQKRSNGLVNFVEKYRSLTKVPKPSIQVVKVSELFERIKILMDTALKGSFISFTSNTKPNNLEIATDPELLEQVLINFLNNSIQSLKESNEGIITLSANIDERGRIIINVIDNGPGIPADIIDKIFIPFFSTKKEGSGIGLSISQQIIRALGGTINVISEPSINTIFTLRF
jgi:two-component system, NtrC family, nitrogen regulation sensor histidine kinase NtrY